MLRFVLAALVFSLCAAIATSPAYAQAETLPAINVDGSMAPLTIDQLDPAERTIYAGLARGSDDARQFLYTRGYLRFARLVMAGRICQNPKIGIAIF